MTESFISEKRYSGGVRISDAWGLKPLCHAPKSGPFQVLARVLTVWIVLFNLPNSQWNGKLR